MSIISHTENKIHLGWHDVDSMVELLAEAVTDHFEGINYIHGVQRGGMIPGVMLSHILNIPYTSHPELLNPREVLIVDDICDSGKTLQRYEKYPTAVLHHKPQTASYTPDIYAVLHNSDAWIMYPWELEDSKTIQDYKLDI